MARLEGCSLALSVSGHQARAGLVWRLGLATRQSVNADPRGTGGERIFGFVFYI